MERDHEDKNWLEPRGEADAFTAFCITPVSENLCYKLVTIVKCRPVVVSNVLLESFHHERLYQRAFLTMRRKRKYSYSSDSGRKNCKRWLLWWSSEESVLRWSVWQESGFSRVKIFSHLSTP
jgi:hypothetical protein